MKYFIAFLSIVCALATSVHAQQLDSKQTAPPQPQGQQGWVRVPIDTNLYVMVTYISPDTCYAINEASYYRSTDGGNSWGRVSWPVIVSGASPFADARHGYVSDGKDQCFHTSDAGQTWAQSNDSNGLIVHVKTVGIDTAFTIGEYVSRTTDGGKTWGHPVDGGWAGLNDAAFYDAHIGIAVGIQQPGPGLQHQDLTAGCFTTIDGGRSWTQHYTGVHATFLAASCLNQTTFLVIGGAGYVSRTSNGGQTWDSIPLPPHYALRAIDFKNHRSLTVGSHGTILTSMDSGLTWVPQTSGITTDLYSIAMQSDSVALAAGDAGVMLRTTNGGTQWVQVSPSSNMSLTSQNYPEPTQSSLQISYSLPQTQDVTVTVTDVTGRIVATPLVRQLQMAGKHILPFDGSQLPTGAYTYTIQTERFFGSGKFTIVR